jgi:hypothetical protein
VARENDDESITKNCIGLIGDLAVLLMQHAGEVAPFFRQPTVNDMISEGLRVANLHDIAQWAQTKCDELLR